MLGEEFEVEVPSNKEHFGFLEAVDRMREGVTVASESTDYEYRIVDGTIVHRFKYGDKDGGCFVVPLFVFNVAEYDWYVT